MEEATDARVQVAEERSWSDDPPDTGTADDDDGEALAGPNSPTLDDLEEYRETRTTRGVVDVAVTLARRYRGRWLMGTTTLFRAIVRSAASGPNPASSAWLLRSYVSDRLDAAVFNREFDGPDLRVEPRLVVLTKRAVEVFQTAQTIAEQTTGQRLIHQRHLLAAFFARVPKSTVASATRQSWQQRVGLDLGSFPRSLFDHVQRNYGESDERISAWRTLLGVADGGDEIRHERRAYPDYASDSGLPLGDALGVMPDVEAFADLICLREATPPLSIGLFGNWGSGKTTFMDRLAEAVEKRTSDEKARQEQLHNVQARTDAAPQPSPYVTDIVQIKFNAWHYADGDIWASLTAEFFDQLRAGGYKKAADLRYANLVKEVAEKSRDAFDLAEVANKELESLQADIKRTLRELDDARSQLDSVGRRVFAHKASEIIDESLKQNKKEIDAAGKAVGIENLSGKPSEFRDQVREAMETAGKVKLIAKTVAGGEARAATLLVGVGLLVVFLTVVGPADIIALWLRIAGLLAGLGAIATPIWRAYTLAKPVIATSAKFAKALADEREELDRRISTKQAELAGLEGTLEAKKQAANDAHERADHYVADDAHRSLLRHFLFESAETHEYEKQLGIISRARKSFERLNSIVAEARKHRVGESSKEHVTGFPNIDRIVLYIDDLDRCRHQQVVKVLEAVHLLLAFDLFVVVVGVDARWMRNALARFYQGEFGEREQDTPPARKNMKIGQLDNAEGHQATPDDYLEKIFQIPFWLRPLTYGESGTYQALIESLTAHDRQDSKTRGKPQLPPVTLHGPGQTNMPADPVRNNTLAITSIGGREHQSESTTVPVPTPLLSIERVPLTEGEIAVLKSAGSMIGGSPRTAKRFLNLYRLIRAQRCLLSPARFLGEGGEVPEFPTVIFLLALVTGLGPDDMRKCIIGIRSESSEDWASIAGDTKSHAAWEFVTALRKQQPLVPNRAYFLELAPIVSRYSFAHVYDGSSTPPDA